MYDLLSWFHLHTAPHSSLLLQNNVRSCSQWCSQTWRGSFLSLVPVWHLRNKRFPPHVLLKPRPLILCQSLFLGVSLLHSNMSHIVHFPPRDSDDWCHYFSLIFTNVKSFAILREGAKGYVQVIPRKKILNPLIQFFSFQTFFFNSKKVKQYVMVCPQLPIYLFTLFSHSIQIVHFPLLQQNMVL